MRSTLRTSLLAVASAAALTAGVIGTAAPAAADHTPLPTRVTLMGSLMSELGCPADWDGGCDLTDLPEVGTSTVFEKVFDVPAGSYELKVRLNGAWDESYGDANGTFGLGGNIALALQHDARLRFTYDHATHAVTVAPADGQPGLQTSDLSLATSSLRKDLSRERFYFVMADRFANGSTANDQGGLTGDRLTTGYDPTAKGFYHGGDLTGLLGKLDYIQGLGTTAIWMTPSFTNKPVQGSPGKESAGYHGYWITDFTTIDPHLGTNADLKTLIKAAHKRGIKVFFDIITNHTADVLDYPDSAYVGPTGNQTVPYVSKADQPYKDAAGNPFDDRDYASGDTFPAIDPAVSFPYQPVVPAGQENVKVPAWLNDPTMYHNRGTSSFVGEDSEYGDFPSGDRSALDDLWTERPEVVNGMVDIYKTWVKDAGVDGFRIDTVKHVDLQFWQRFAPALKGYAASLGDKDFFMFGEVYDANPAFMSRYTTAGKLQATVDFGFQASATAYARGEVGKTGASAKKLQQFFASDDWFTDGDSNAYSLPTFLGNHDMGRIGKFLTDSGATGTALLQRDELAHELMFTTRGQPVVYYGDEQGFTGDGGDQDARQDMFASKVATYNDDDLIGTSRTTATSSYNTSHPMYRLIKALSKLRANNPALADGAQIHRYADDGPGIYAFSRISPKDKVEYVVAANSADTTKSATFPTYSKGVTFTRVWPKGDTEVRGSLRTDSAKQIKVRVPARSVVVYRATKSLRNDSVSPQPTVSSPQPGAVLEGRTPVGVDVAVDDLNQATVLWRTVGGTTWTVAGTDDNAPYRVFHDVSGLPKGSIVEYRIVVKDHDGDLGVTSTWGVVGKAPVVIPPVGPVTQPTAVGIPGSHGSEIGCPDSTTDGGTDPGDWDPTCEQAQLALDANDQIWKGTKSPQAGGYAFKAAMNRAWDENYGVGGVANGGDVGYTADGNPVHFYYDHRTHWVTNDRISDIVVATGSFQSELGCSADGDVACMRAWLQDPDGNKVFSLGMTDVPAGTYTVQVARNGTLEGPTQTFTVADGEVTTFTYDPAGTTLTVTTEPPA
jgi:glycosidase